jgi:hypothetical protein
MKKRLMAISVAFLIGIAPHIAQAQECANPKSDWIFCEDFESDPFLAQWQEVSHKNDRQVRETNTTHVFSGQSSLKLIFPLLDQTGGGWMHHWWQPASNQGEVFLRWYVKYSSGFNYGGWDLKMAGLEAHLPGVRYRPGAGFVPDGTWYQSRVSALGVPDPRGPEGAEEPFFYYYHPDQISPWGDFGYQNRFPQVPFQDNRWYCIEIGVKPNTVQTNPNGSYTGLYDGEQTLWIDGVEKAYYNGIRWRMNPNVQMNDLFQSAWVGTPLATSVQYRWEDNYVVSTKRIGCSVQSGASAPAPPTSLRVQ